MLSLAVMPEPGGEGGRLSPPITTGTPMFFTFRHHYVLTFTSVKYKQVSCSYANKHILLYNNYDHIIKSLNYIIDYRKQCYVAIMNLSREFELTWIIMP